ncbi:MAG TPA: TRAP transporter substrate-binding protein [Dehalococcoidia bacterium]|nr:TRAP transporter substrate-binding protein [Dehalococcoidia bacterium]
MKKLLYMVLVITLLTFPFFGSCGEEEPTEVIELTYSNFFPPSHLHSVLVDQFCQEIEERTDGWVKITHYPGGSLTPAAGVYDGVVEGISDIGMSVLAYNMGRFPTTELVDLPHGYPSGWVASKVANDYYEKFKPDEFNDVHVLYFHAHGPGCILTVDKPVRTLEDMQGLVLRSTGVGAKIAEALGATGYAASQGEAYELMSKGVIDGSVTPPEVLKGWNQAEIVKYLTTCYDVGYTADMFVVMNKAKWESLPDKYKKVFNEVCEEWIEKHAKVWSYYDKIALDYFMTFPGREVISLSQNEMARWVAAAASVKNTYMSEKGAMGLDVEDMEEYLNDRVDYWSDRAPTAEECVEWVEAEVLPDAPQ